MIIKDLDRFESNDILAKAGRRAEEQMAHYLRRAFGETNEFRVFHDLRLERDGEAAQIDHLVLHNLGVFLIESKSVTTEVQVNEHGEWTRRVSRSQVRGMPSPVEQANRQAQFLRAYLEAHREQLLGKVLGIQGSFNRMPIEVLVAISDEGIIKRPKVPLGEVVKADQITGRVLLRLKELRRVNSLFNLNPLEVGWEFGDPSINRVTAFLLSQHRPSRRTGTLADVVQVPEAKPAAAPKTERAATSSPGYCRECGSVSLRVQSGRYGYYFKCLECNGNTPIRLTCAQCGGPEKIRMSGQNSFAECRECRTSRPHFTNPS